MMTLPSRHTELYVQGTCFNIHKCVTNFCAARDRIFVVLQMVNWNFIGNLLMKYCSLWMLEIFVCSFEYEIIAINF